MDDNKILLHEVQSMDAAALARVFDLYATALYKYAYRHCGHAIIADQIVGDVFARLMDQLSQGCGPSSNLRSYLFEIAHHLVVDHIRYSRRMAPIDISTLPARPPPTPTRLWSSRCCWKASGAPSVMT